MSVADSTKLRSEATLSSKPFSFAFGFLFLALFATFPDESRAAEVEWRDEPPPGLVINESLETVLLQMTADHGLKAVISDELEGRVTLDFQGMTIDKIMDELAIIHQFDWFYDGRTVYFFPVASVSQKILHLDRFDIGTLVDVLDDLQLIDQRYPIIGSDDASVAVIKGPMQYLTLVEQTLEAMMVESEDEGPDINDNSDPEKVIAKASRAQGASPEPCPPLTRRPECLPRVTYGYGAN